MFQPESDRSATTQNTDSDGHNAHQKFFEESAALTQSPSSQNSGAELPTNADGKKISWEQAYQQEQHYIADNYFSKKELDHSKFHADVNHFTGHIKSERDYTTALKKTASDVGDLWTEFKTNDDIAKEQQHSAEGFRSAGVWLKEKNGHVAIDNVLYGFPAYKSLKIGDTLLAINGKPVAGQKAADLEKSLEGKPGDHLNLTVRSREGHELHVDLPIGEPEESPSKADVITDAQTGKSYLKLQMLSFNKEASDQLEDSIKAISKDKLDQVSGVILDMRGNEGGTIPPIVRTADMFVPPGKTLFNIDSRDGSQAIKSAGFAESDYTLDADTRHKLRELPLVVMVDGTTRSAPETLLASLQDQHRVKAVVGEKTYGKGILYYDTDAPDGTLRVSQDLVRTPSGRIIHHHGIVPDHIVDNPRGGGTDLQLIAAERAFH